MNSQNEDRFSSSFYVFPYEKVPDAKDKCDYVL